MRNFHLHLVSDATGETLNSVARAVVTQFEGVRPIEHSWALVRSLKHLDRVLQAIAEAPGVVMFTVVERDLRKQLQAGCDRLNVPCIPVLDPVIASLSDYLGVESRGQPGRQHEMNTEYFGRIEAMRFTMAHDDGQRAEHLDQSDMILVGVSRTSKTPTSIYLANRGYKVSNIPVVPACPLPPQLEGLSRPLVVGLTANAERLIQVRQNRLRSLNQTGETDYVELEAVRQELIEARRLFTKRGWPVIDVTRRSIEETAAAILNLYFERNGLTGSSDVPSPSV